MPWNNEVVIATQVIIQGTNEGLFVYNGAPGLGRLIASVTNAPTDPYGNPTKPVTAVYGTADGSSVVLVPGSPAEVNIGSGDSAETVPAALTSAIFGAPAPQRFVQTILRAARVSGQDAFRDASITIEGDAVDHSFPTDIRYDVVKDSTTHSNITQLADSIQFQGSPSSMLFIDLANKQIVAGYPIYGASSQGGVGPDNPPHLMTLLNSWANAGGNTPAQYSLTANNEVLLTGAINGAAATAATFATLPVAYRPNKQQQIPCGATGNVIANHAPFIQLDTAGNLTVSQTVALPAAGVFLFNGRIPLLVS